MSIKWELKLQGETLSPTLFLFLNQLKNQNRTLHKFSIHYHTSKQKVLIAHHRDNWNSIHSIIECITEHHSISNRPLYSTPVLRFRLLNSSIFIYFVRSNAIYFIHYLWCYRTWEYDLFENQVYIVKYVLSILSWSALLGSPV